MLEALRFAFLKCKAIGLHYFNGFGFTLNNRKVATKKSGTKKIAKTVAESMPPMVPVPIAFWPPDPAPFDLPTDKDAAF